MWIYDGDQWIEEGVNEKDKETKREETARPEEMLPDLEVVEIVPVPQTHYVPPFPLP